MMPFLAALVELGDQGLELFDLKLRDVTALQGPFIVHDKNNISSFKNVNKNFQFAET
jgi:hypothetical protein